MTCPCCGPQTCDCELTAPVGPFPLPEGKTLKVELTLLPKEGLSSLQSEMTLKFPLAPGPGLQEYAGGGWVNYLTGEIAGGGSPPSDDFTFGVGSYVRCVRGGGYGSPFFQGNFALYLSVSSSGAADPNFGRRFSFGYRENGEWVYNPWNAVWGLTGFGLGLFGIRPVVQDGLCLVDDSQIVRWPIRESGVNPDDSTDYSCEDVGLCAEARVIVE